MQPGLDNGGCGSARMGSPEPPQENQSTAISKMDDDDPDADAPNIAPALPPSLQLGTALAHSKGEAAAFTRYSALRPEDTPRWREIFKGFDRDNGGDVDLRELGLMFRQLGQSPSEEQMRLFIEEVRVACLPALPHRPLSNPMR